MASLTSMLSMSLTQTLAMQKLVNLVDEFDGSDCSENKARKTSASTKKTTKANYLCSKYVSHAVSNFVSNTSKTVSNYITLDTKKAFD